MTNSVPAPFAPIGKTLPAIPAVQQSAKGAECHACDIAQVNVRTGHFNANCKPCAARSLAQSPLYADAMQADAITPLYRDALRLFIGDDVSAAHAQVKGFAALLQAAERKESK